MNQNLFKKFTLFTYFSHHFVSKWIILFIDLILISFSLIVSFALLRNAALHQISMIEYYKGLISVIGFACIGHYAFKPHRGIIRHTSLVDIKRVFYARTLSFVLNLGFIFFISDWINIQGYRLPFSVAAMNYVISSYMLIQF